MVRANGVTPSETARPLRILQIIEPSGGGSGRHYVDLCRTLVEKGHEVTAIYSPVRAEDRFVQELQALPVKAVHSVAMRRLPHPSDLAAWLQIWKIMRREGPFDIIHGHSSKAGVLARLRLPTRHPTARIYTPHAFRTMDPTLGARGRMVFGKIESLFGRFFTDRLICVSEDEYEHALALGIPQDILATVINGVQKPDTRHRGEIRDSFGFGNDDFVFGFIGRLAHQKAPERLVKAFASISAAFPAARLVMVGSGDLAGEIETLITSLDLTGKVVITSAVHGADAVQAFDALAMPSRYEAMSYAMLEAGAAGKPMVLTHVGGATTVVDDGVNGRIIENSDDPHDLAMAMLEFRETDKAAAYTLAAYLREDRYQLDHMVEETVAVYRRALGQLPENPAPYQGDFDGQSAPKITKATTKSTKLCNSR
jgi:glycosyltransferase involved in cell wall biosynthesis